MKNDRQQNQQKVVRLHPKNVRYALQIRENVKLLQHTATRLRDYELTEKQLAKPPPRWRKSLMPPEALVAQFEPFLEMKPGLRLVAYQEYGFDLGGIGVVYAIPTNARYPEPGRCMISEGEGRVMPRPPEALDNPMEAIVPIGISTDAPLTYLMASILAREIDEFGAYWHSIRWGNKTILINPPWRERKKRFAQSIIPSPAKEEWVSDREPSVWAPHVLEDKDSFTVVFNVYGAHGGIAVFEHRDVYAKGNGLTFSTTSEIIATAPNAGVVMH